jgi:hypothetical protein
MQSKASVSSKCQSWQQKYHVHKAITGPQQKKYNGREVKKL